MIMLNTPPAAFICQCGKESHTAGGTPAGWEWHGATLLCDDCVRTAAFSHGGESAAPPAPPTPIRRADDADKDTAILLRSGAYLDLADPDCSRIAAIDIASGLRQFRFAAQTPEAYTIAQHSLLVLDLVDPVAEQIGGQGAADLRWCALMHDAAEAFIHDIARPLKVQLPDYKRIEKQLETRFAAAFGIRWTSRRHQIVKMADLQALAIEKRDLCPYPEDNRPWPILKAIKTDRLAAIRIDRVWSPAEAEARFLEAFTRLAPESLGQQERAA